MFLLATMHFDIFFSLIPMHPNIFWIYCWYVKYLRTYAGSFNLQRKNIYHHSGIHKLPNWRNIHQIVHWKNRMKGIRCYMTAIMNKEGTEKHKKLKSRSICGKWSLNKILILIGTLVIQKFKSVSYRKFRLE